MNVISKSRAIAAEIRALLAGNVLTFLLAVILQSGFVAALDVFTDERMATLFGSAGIFIASAVLNFKLLQYAYPEDNAITPRMKSLFGLSILSSTAMLCGAVLLIVPGIFLYLRWFLAWPLLVHERLSVVESLRRSWRVMRGWEFPVFLILAALVLFFFLAFAILALFGLNSARPSGLLPAFAFNFSLYLPLLLTYIAAVACHLVIGRGSCAGPMVNDEDLSRLDLLDLIPRLTHRPTALQTRAYV